MKKRWYRNSGIKGLLVFLAIITLTAAFVCGECYSMAAEKWHVGRRQHKIS